MFHKAASKAGQKEFMRSMARYQKDILPAVEDAARESSRIIESSLGGQGIGAQVRRALYALQRASLLRVANDLWSGQVDPSIMEHMDQAIKAAGTSQEMIMSVLVKGLGKGRAALASSLSEASANAFANIESRYINSINLSPRVFRNTALMAGKIDEIVNNGILLEQSAAEIAASVEGYINPSVMGGTKYAAMRLGRTELNNAFHTTSVQAYQQSPWVDGVLWELSGSHPADDECDEFATEDDFGLGEGVWPSDAVPDKPHPQCFCFTTAVTPSPTQFARNLLAGQYGSLAA